MGALSTAAAVAAMSSCFTTPHAHTHTHTHTQPGVTNLTNGVINGSSGAPSPSDIDVSFTVPSMLSVLPLVSALPSSTNINGTAATPAPFLQQQQQQLHVSANTSASTTPCPTPGILNTANLSPSSRQQQRSNAPPTAIPGAAMFTQTSSTAPLPTPLAQPPALPQHTHTQARTSSSMLPQNQLVYGNNAPVSSAGGTVTATVTATPINVNTAGNPVPAPTTSTAPTTIHHNPMTHTQPPNQQQQQQQQQLTTLPQQQIQRLSHPGAIPLPAPSTFHHLQQHPLNTTAATSFRPRPVQISKPNIFANMALRRGKWTSEEERFANALIEEFEKGTILDCENGCTLRAYLSRKLHCAPMRISKKYAGKSIGKHVFLSRIPALLNRNGLTIGVNGVGRVGVGTTMGVGANGSTTTNLNNNSVRSTQENLDKIRDLEFHFHMSLLQEGAACTIGHNIGKRLTSGVVGGSSSRNVVGNMGNMGCVQGGHASVLPRTLATAGGVSGAPLTSAFPMIFPSPHANFPQSNPATTVSAPTSYLNQASSSNGIAKTPAVPAAPFHWFTPGPITTNPNLTLPSPATDLQMQDSLFNAFKEAQTSSSNLPSASTLSNTVSTGQQQNQEVSNLLQPNFSIVPTSNANGNGGSPLPNSAQALTAAAASSQPSLKDGQGLFSNNNTVKDNSGAANNGMSQQSQQQNSAISTSQAQQNWLSETMHIIPTLDPSSYMGQFSPTYTSQSFDDLHQFIGKDCPPSDSTTTELKGPATEAANKLQQMSQGLVTGNISAADSYALFAQQSAMAVSKHSAYAVPNHHPNHNHQQVDKNVSSVPVSNICNNEIYSASTHTHTITKPTEPLISSGAVNVTPAISTSAQITRPTSTQQAITIMSSPVKQIQNTRNNSTNNAGVKMENVTSSSTATFNAVNLRLHSASVKLREMVDNAESDTVSSSSGDIVPTTTASSAKYSSSSRLRHTNLVSGSDRSSSDNGNESMSAGGSGSSGSDNSDAASDEGQSSSNPTNKSKRRIDINEGNQEKKRQKTTTKQETVQ